MLGGIGNDSKPCSDDAYLFDVELLKWYQVSLVYIAWVCHLGSRVTYPINGLLYDTFDCLKQTDS